MPKSDIDALVMPKPEVMVARAAEAFDEQGNLVDETARKFLQDLLSQAELPGDRQQPYPFLLASPLETRRSRWARSGSGAWSGSGTASACS